MVVRPVEVAHGFIPPLPGQVDVLPLAARGKGHDREFEIEQEPAERRDLLELCFEHLAPCAQDEAALLDGFGLVLGVAALGSVAQSLKLVGSGADLRLKLVEADEHLLELGQQRVDLGHGELRGGWHFATRTLRLQADAVKVRFRFWICGLLFASIACDEPTGGGRPALASHSPQAAPDEVRLVGVSSEVFDGDELRSRARSDELRVDRKKGTVVASNIEIERFDRRSKRTTGKLRADRATGHTARRDVQLEGNVVVTDGEGMRATTERAEYVEAEGLLRLPGEVSLHGENFEAKGASAVYSFETEKLEVAPPIRAVVGPGL